MARKSRKQPIYSTESTARVEIETDFIRESTLATAAYIRLSRENGGHETDDTLQTQIKLVHSYILEQPELSLIDTYVDNGVSGTKFDRPEFNRLMQDVKTGRVQCIVVKDLSRFGRDYLETGYYLDQIFPLLNVRFIAITDQYDSNRPDSRIGLITPIKNMINAMYAKDYSRKIRATIKAKQEQGIVRNGTAPYGYRYDEATKHFQIDPVAEPYVRLIFAWHLAGVSRSQISERLNALQAPTPGGQRFGRKNNWYPEVVRHFLISPSYVGCIALGQQERNMDVGSVSVKKPRNEWKFFPDSHEAYLTQEDSDWIMEQMAETKKQMDKSMERTKETRLDMPDVFHGKVICGCCGAKMRHRRISHHSGEQNATFQIYRCLNRKKSPDCKNNHIFQQNYLKIVVMDQIRLLIQAICDKDALIRDVEKKYGKEEKLNPIERKIQIMKERLEAIEKRLLRAYTDYVDHALDKEEYLRLKEKLITNRGEQVNALQEQQKKLENTKAAILEYHAWADRLRGNLKATAFDELLVNELVSKITIYDIEHIEVEFTCKDMFSDEHLIEFMLDREGENEL